MDKFIIAGNGPLDGVIDASGAKNAALPILCASLLSDEPLHVTNVPTPWDINTTRKLLSQMGCTVDAPALHELIVDAKPSTTCVSRSEERTSELQSLMRITCAGCGLYKNRGAVAVC